MRGNVSSTFIATYLLLNLAIAIALIWVVVHFVVKFW